MRSLGAKSGGEIPEFIHRGSQDERRSFRQPQLLAQMRLILRFREVLLFIASGISSRGMISCRITRLGRAAGRWAGFDGIPEGFERTAQALGCSLPQWWVKI